MNWEELYWEANVGFFPFGIERRKRAVAEFHAEELQRKLDWLTSDRSEPEPIGMVLRYQ